MRLTDERRWLLKRWAGDGWSINLRPEKKWEAHLAQLVKGGLLEKSGEDRSAMYRITDKGRAALHDEGAK